MRRGDRVPREFIRKYCDLQPEELNCGCPDDLYRFRLGSHGPFGPQVVATSLHIVILLRAYNNWTKLVIGSFRQIAAVQ